MRAIRGILRNPIHGPVVLHAGTAIGQVAGLLQVEARVPDGIAAGRQPVVLTVGEARSQPGVFVMIG